MTASRSTSIPLHKAEPYEVPMLWDMVYPIMLEAEGLFKGRMKVSDILHECMMKRMQLWVVGEIEACAVTQLIAYPQLKACRYILISGKGLDNWIMADEIITGWAKQENCAMMEGTGRKGWAAKVKPLGWVAKTSLFEKAI